MKKHAVKDVENNQTYLLISFREHPYDFGFVFLKAFGAFFVFPPIND